MSQEAPDRTNATRAEGSHDRARVVRRYLSALDARRPGRSPARTVESLLHRIHQIDTLLLSADPVQRLHLTQERIDLHAEQLRLSGAAGTEFSHLERAFERLARAYGDRHGLSYSAWRQVGVDAEVLTRAGITASKPASRPRPEVAGSPNVDEDDAAPAKGAAVAAKASAAPAAPAGKKATTKKTPGSGPAKATKPAKANGATAKPVLKAAAKTEEPKDSEEQQLLPADAGA